MTTPPTPAEVVEARADLLNRTERAAERYGNDFSVCFTVAELRAALAAPAEQPREDAWVRAAEDVATTWRTLDEGGMELVEDNVQSLAAVLDRLARLARSVSPSAVPAVSAGGAGRDLTAADVESAVLIARVEVWEGADRVADYLNRIARPELATAPTPWDLRATLCEIADTATEGDGILQPGAAYALGKLADLVRAQPGCLPENVADAIADVSANTGGHPDPPADPGELCGCGHPHPDPVQGCWTDGCDCARFGWPDNLAADTGTQATEQTTEYRAVLLRADYSWPITQFGVSQALWNPDVRVEYRTKTASPWSPVAVHDEEQKR